VDTKLESVDEVLGQVRALLAELAEEIALVREIPQIKAQLDDIHAAVKG
jgi:hypothetical protein